MCAVFELFELCCGDDTFVVQAGCDAHVLHFSLIEALQSQQQDARKTVLLSATLTSAVERLAGLTLRSPVYVDAVCDESLTSDLVIPQSMLQFCILTPAKLRLVTLSAFIIWKCQMSDQRKMLIFCATQDMVDFHTELLSRVLGLSDHVDVSFFKLHGSMTQKVCRCADGVDYSCSVVCVLTSMCVCFRNAQMCLRRFELLMLAFSSAQ